MEGQRQKGTDREKETERRDRGRDRGEQERGTDRGEQTEGKRQRERDKGGETEGKYIGKERKPEVQKENKQEHESTSTKGKNQMRGIWNAKVQNLGRRGGS